MIRADIKALDPARTVVVATGNAHKVTEIEAILAPVMPGVRFVALGELGDFPDPVEDGETFFDNALIKARAAQAQTGLPMAVADDSGLCVDALGGAPGIFSARWAGEHGNDAANNDKLMAQMAEVPDERRTARFHSSVVLVRGDEVLRGDGDCEGLSPTEKTAISHRFHALEDLSAKLCRAAARAPPAPSRFAPLARDHLEILASQSQDEGVWGAPRVAVDGQGPRRGGVLLIARGDLALVVAGRKDER